MKRVVIFGAGSIGRGFVGASFAAAGWRVTFIDVVASLVERLGADGAYHQVVVGNDGERVVRVEPVDALMLDDSEGVVEALASADFAATAVGAANLPAVAELLAGAVVRREELGVAPLDVLVCENLHDAPEVLRSLIAERVGPERARALGLLGTSIGRMVPVPIPDPDDPTRVRVEEYSFLPYDAAALCGPEPDVPDLVPIGAGFEIYSDRKLYLHSLGHCVLAYLGELGGDEFLWEAAAQLDLRYLARGAMVESAIALATVHDQPIAPLLEHVDDLLSRFTNRALGDTVERVGRDPERKMQPDDRLLGSYLLCRRAGVEPRHVAVAVALGAWRLGREDGWGAERARAFLDQHLFQTHPEGRALVLDLIDLLDVAAPAVALVERLDATFRPSRVV